MKKLKSDDNTDVIFQDEVHFKVTVSVTQKWYPKGSKPKVKSAPGNKSVAYSGYVNPDTGELIVTKPSWFNYETVIQSFRDLISEYILGNDKHICLILDNAPWHKKAVRLIQTETLPEYQDISNKMTFVFLPAYSPDLNPIEQMWRITRREVTHNTYFPNETALENSLDSYFSMFRNPNDKIASLCSFFNLS